jgi:hypothetical protein
MSYWEENKMETALEYMERIRPRLINGYRAENSPYCDSCSLVACVIGKRLFNEGKSPEMWQVYDVRSGLTLEMIPRVVDPSFQLAWATHFVCCESGLAYEPLLERPTPIDKYVSELFGRKFNFFRFKDSREFKEFIVLADELL